MLPTSLLVWDSAGKLNQVQADLLFLTEVECALPPLSEVEAP